MVIVISTSSLDFSHYRRRAGSFRGALHLRRASQATRACVEVPQSQWWPFLFDNRDRYSCLLRVTEHKFALSLLTVF